MSLHESDLGTAYHEAGQARDDDPVTHEEHVSRDFHRMGEVLPYADTVNVLVMGEAGQVGQSERAAAADHTHNFLVKSTGTSAPTDANFSEGFTGTIAIATIGGVPRLYVRFAGGTWRFVNLT